MKCMKFLPALTALLLLPLASQANSDGKARVVTMGEKPAQCLSAVTINQIDGEERFVHPEGFEIEPGRHSMTGRAKLNTAYCPVVRGRAGTKIPPLEAEFEAGKTYYVGFDHRSKDRAEWELVIWKVE